MPGKILHLQLQQYLDQSNKSSSGMEWLEAKQQSTWNTIFIDSIWFVGVHGVEILLTELCSEYLRFITEPNSNKSIKMKNIQPLIYGTEDITFSHPVKGPMAHCSSRDQTEHC